MTPPSCSRTAAIGAVLCLLVIGAESAHAQLSSAQQSAMRSNCRSDFMSKCSGVPTGGREALQCLQKNVDSLSAGCQAVVKTTLPPPAAAAPAPAKTEPPPPKAASVPPPAAPASPPPPAAPAPAAAPTPPATPSAQQQAAIRQSCQSDFMSHCRGVQPGPGAMQCLQRNAARLSPGCRSAIAAVSPPPAAPKAASAPPPQRATAPAAAAPAQAPVMVKQLSLRERAAIARICETDKDALCRLVRPGGNRVVECLVMHRQSLSPSCRAAVANAIQ